MHGTLSDKKRQAAVLDAENQRMRERLESRVVEEKNRKLQLEDLHVKLHGELSGRQQVENLQMQKNMLSIQEKITTLNEENVHVGETHKANKAKLADQLGVMRAL